VNEMRPQAACSQVGILLSTEVGIFSSGTSCLTATCAGIRRQFAQRIGSPGAVLVCLAAIPSAGRIGDNEIFSIESVVN
jgi:hypothetical protein